MMVSSLFQVRMPSKLTILANMFLQSIKPLLLFRRFVYLWLLFQFLSSTEYNKRDEELLKFRLASELLVEGHFYRKLCNHVGELPCLTFFWAL